MPENTQAALALVETIKAALAIRGWSDGEFCRQLGISQSVWSRVKNGQRALQLDFLQQVARCLPELKGQIAALATGDYVTGRRKR